MSDLVGNLEDRFSRVAAPIGIWPDPESFLIIIYMAISIGNAPFHSDGLIYQGPVVQN